MATAKSKKGRQATDEELEGKTSEDVVAVASVRKDGTPDQSPDFKFIDAEMGEEVLEAQVKSAKGQNVDHVQILREEGRGRPTPKAEEPT